MLRKAPKTSLLTAAALSLGLSACETVKFMARDARHVYKLALSNKTETPQEERQLTHEERHKIKLLEYAAAGQDIFLHCEDLSGDEFHVYGSVEVPVDSQCHDEFEENLPENANYSTQACELAMQTRTKSSHLECELETKKEGTLY